jgi:shikimate kinase/3-dehydroquinate synthase
VAAVENAPAIVFCGFMAAGKSSAARAAAEALGTEARDADELIEAELGESIASFFERRGEEEFRRRERDLVLSLLEGGGVISLGGGAIESEPVRRALADHLCAWCQVDEEVAWERARDGSRPLAADRGEFSRRLRERTPLYESVARAILPEGGREIGAAAAPWLAAMRGLPGTRMAWALTGSSSYPAIVGPGSIGALAGAREAAPATLPARSFCVADRGALAAQRALLPSCEVVIEVEGAESSKTLTEAERVLRELAGAGARRDDCLLAFGGGVVGDLTGFCAATYQRGIPVIQVPTTLVAQVDSAYGGKTGVDLPEAKNYVGAFHQPLAVLADPATLATLPAEELASGFVEVLKTALLAGGGLWERAREVDSLEPEALVELIFDCARFKLEVVAEDERDSGRRAILNLGHTVGHAIEASTGYARYRHGEAVGLGLLAALRLSGAGELREQVAGALARHRLPVELDPSVEAEAVVEALGRDKKRTVRGVGFVLLERPGAPRWGEPVEPDRVLAAVDELRDRRTPPGRPRGRGAGGDA